MKKYLRVEEHVRQIIKLAEERKRLEDEKKRKQEQFRQKLLEQQELSRKEQEDRIKSEERRRNKELEAVKRSRELAADLARDEASQKAIRDQRRQDNLNEVEKYKALIAEKVKENLVLPQSLEGNPEVIYSIMLTFDGRLVSSPQLISTSGSIIYDEAVDKAIRKSDPLPVPQKRELYMEYFQVFKLRFRPKE